MRSCDIEGVARPSALHALAIFLEHQDKMTIFKGHIPKDLEAWLEEHISISLKEINAMIDQVLGEIFTVK